MRSVTLADGEAIVVDGTRVLSNIVSSQIDLGRLGVTRDNPDHEGYSAPIEEVLLDGVTGRALSVQAIELTLAADPENPEAFAKGSHGDGSNGRVESGHVATTGQDADRSAVFLPGWHFTLLEHHNARPNL